MTVDDTSQLEGSIRLEMLEDMQFERQRSHGLMLVTAARLPIFIAWMPTPRTVLCGPTHRGVLPQKISLLARSTKHTQQ
jgi:hypothetical protein